MWSLKQMVGVFFLHNNDDDGNNNNHPQQLPKESSIDSFL